MACLHKNPYGSAFCVVCGERLAHVRCQHCGAVSDPRYLFCGQCGCSMKEGDDVVSDLPSDNRTYDLAALMQAVESEHTSHQFEPKNKASQDDIEAMLAAMKKGK